MFIYPVSWQSHAEYRKNFKRLKAGFSSDLRHMIHFTYFKEQQMLMSLNLDQLGMYISRYYSTTGRTAIHQAQIFRSLILFTLLFNKTQAKTSLTSWVNDILPHNIVLIALIGCSSPQDLPPLGSYYDLMNRLWGACRKYYSRSYLLPADRNSKKPKKEIGSDGKLVDDSKNHAYDLVDRLIDNKPIHSNPEAALQDIFYLLAVLPSVQQGLIKQDNLTISGDGTAVVSHSYPHGKKSRHRDLCVDDNLRHFSDPDATWGWDSSNKTWYFGHTLYMLCYRNNELKLELPLTIKFTNAKRHDSLNFLYAIDDFGKHTFGLSPKNICLDSAHDNIPTYELLDRWDINALIDINGRANKSDGAPKDIHFDKQGHPCCRADYRMLSRGFEPTKRAKKYVCPYRQGHVKYCPYVNECSPTSYGRTIYLKRNRNLRYFTRIPRDSQEYKDIYSERTACERVNDRVLNDYSLQFLRIRGVDHFSFWTMLIGICIHLDARYKASI